jgi:hypothetical protein
MAGPFKGKTPQTKLGHQCRELATKIKDEFQIESHELDRAAANLDMAAISLGATGERVKTLGSYYAAHQLYQSVADRTGNPKL